MWSMPRSVLKVVAVLIALCAVGGFVLGIRGAPEKARLPGEGPAGVQLQAAEAKPLGNEVLTPLPPVVAEVEDKVPEAPKAAPDPLDLAADQAPPQTVASATPAKTTLAKPPTLDKPGALASPPVAVDRVGDLLDGITPPPVDPPH